MESASILLVVEGEADSVEVSPQPVGDVPVATSVQRGSVLFLAAGQSLSLKFKAGSRFLAFRAVCVL